MIHCSCKSRASPALRLLQEHPWILAGVSSPLEYCMMQSRADAGVQVLNCICISMCTCQACPMAAHQPLTVSPHAVCRFWQGQAPLAHRMTFQPASLSAGFHKRLTAVADRRHAKQMRVRHTTTLHDPLQERAKKEKEEEERIRNKEALMRKQVCECAHACELRTGVQRPCS